MSVRNQTVPGSNVPVDEVELLEVLAAPRHVQTHLHQVEEGDGGHGADDGAGPAGAEVGEQVPALHQLQDQEVGVIVQADGDQAQDVLVLEVPHQLCLLQKLALLRVTCS